MNLAVEALSAPARKVLSAGAPLPMKMLGAKGVIPGAPPPDALTVIVALTESAEAKVAQSATDTLKAPPRALLEGALGATLQRDVVAAIAKYHGKDIGLLPQLLRQENLDLEILCDLSSGADEPSGELIATNEALLLRFPGAIEKLYMNKLVRMSTSDRLIELAVRNQIDLDFPAFKLAAQAILSQLVPEPTLERTFDDLQFLETERKAVELQATEEEDVCERDDEGQEKIVEKIVPLYKQLQDCSITQRIRRAMLGSSTERLLLVRDNNRLVAEAAAKSPRMTENDAARIALSRSVSDEVLRIIANNRELTRSYQVKLNLVANPRTPLTFSSRLLPHLRQNDLQHLAKSKNVPGAVQKAARNQLSRRK